MQVADIATITSQFFSPALSTAPTAGSGTLLANNMGMVVTDLDDIEQCANIILQTPLGSDPHRPNFGADLDQYIDWPISAARPRIAREVQRALAQWEPRMSLLQVTVQAPGAGQLVVTYSWKPSSNYSGVPIVTNLALGQLAS